MARTDGRELSLAERLTVQLERFRDVPAASWGISTGAVGLFAAVQTVAYPEWTTKQVLGSYGVVMVAGLVAAAVYATQRPSLSQRMLEARRCYNAACMAFDDKRYEDAVAGFREAWEKDPGNYPYVSKYGRVLLRLGRYEEAIAVLTSCWEMAPSKSGRLAALRNRGVAELVVNEWGKARRDFSEYLDSKKNNSPVRRLRSIVYLALAEHERAEADARQAVEIAPTSCAAHATLATVLAVRGETDAARESLAIAHDRDHDAGDALYALAQAHAQLGDTDDAFRLLEQAIDADAKFGPRAKRDPLLESLRHDLARFGPVVDVGGKIGKPGAEDD